MMSPWYKSEDCRKFYFCTSLVQFLIFTNFCTNLLQF